MDGPDREWTERDAKDERVSRRVCVACKTHRENLSPKHSLRTIETGEVICDPCLRRTRRFGRDVDVDLRVNGELDENTREVVRQSFRYLAARLDGVRRVEVATSEAADVEALDLSEVEVSERDGPGSEEVVR